MPTHDRRRTVMVSTRLHIINDADILGVLAGVDNVQGYVKKALRDRIAFETAAEDMDQLVMAYAKSIDMTFTLKKENDGSFRMVGMFRGLPDPNMELDTIGNLTA